MALGLMELVILVAGGLCCLLVPAGIAIGVVVSRRSKSDDAREGPRE